MELSLRNKINTWSPRDLRVADRSKSGDHPKIGLDLDDSSSENDYNHMLVKEEKIILCYDLAYDYFFPPGSRLNL